MAKIKSPKEVEYLAFEGGGGKGIAFVGALEALEEREVLPIHVTEHEENQIKGISGASAGAITALGVAIGMTSKDFRKVVKEGVTRKGKTVTLADFMDAPRTGQSRCVNNCKPNTEAVSMTDLIAFLGRVGLSYSMLFKEAGSLKKTLIALLPLFLGPVAGAGAAIAGNDMLRRLLPQMESYIINMIFDKGLFPGFAAREFFTILVNNYLVDKLKKEDYVGVPDASVLGFKQFREYTGIDFVVAGTNVTKGVPAYFSADVTPDFPVVEAVAISMNIPFLFKPVRIKGSVTGNKALDERVYHGLWMDGGTLNNLPLHAFDAKSTLKCDQDGELKPIHPGMLGLRLSPPNSDSEDAKACKSGGIPIVSVLLESLDTYSLLDYGGDFLSALMYYSEEGQIRTPHERDHTIELNTYCLGMTEFSPPEEKTKKPIADAKKMVETYFAS